MRTRLPTQGTQVRSPVWQLSPGAAAAEDCILRNGANPPQREAHSHSQRQPLLVARRGRPHGDPAWLAISTQTPRAAREPQPASVWGTWTAASGSLLPAPPTAAPGPLALDLAPRTPPRRTSPTRPGWGRGQKQEAPRSEGLGPGSPSGRLWVSGRTRPGRRAAWERPSSPQPSTPRGGAAQFPG